MNGRVLSELLRDGPASESVRVERSVHRDSTEFAYGKYQIELHQARAGPADYVDYTQTKR